MLSCYCFDILQLWVPHSIQILFGISTCSCVKIKIKRAKKIKDVLPKNTQTIFLVSEIGLNYSVHIDSAASRCSRPRRGGRPRLRAEHPPPPRSLPHLPCQTVHCTDEGPRPAEWRRRWRECVRRSTTQTALSSPRVSLSLSLSPCVYYRRTRELLNSDPQVVSPRVFKA